jgi:hypothetical protein
MKKYSKAKKINKDNLHLLMRTLLNYKWSYEIEVFVREFVLVIHKRSPISAAPFTSIEINALDLYDNRNYIFQKINKLKTF